jgi:outer membrane protein assembly factor BamB
MMTSVAAAAEPTWPQWRGPTRDGQVTGPAWPDDLKGLTPRWRVEFGPSYSGPIVAGDRVFTTETKDKSEEVVTALDRATGKVIWQARWPGALDVPFFARANGSWIRSTPAFDGESLFVAGIRDVLVCLDANDGKERWRVDFVGKYGTPLPAFGFVCSPLVDGDAVFVQAGASVFRLDKRTGAEAWRSLGDAGGMNGSAFSSPVLADVAGRRQLLVQTREKLAGLDPESGATLWSQEIKAFRGMNILTPIVTGNGLFTSSYGGKSVRLNLAGSDANFRVETAWTSKAEGYMSTPVVVADHAYLHLRNQRVTCLDLTTGKPAWTTDKSFGKYWNLVANGERILALDERGILFLLRANPTKFDLLDEKKVGDQETWAHLAVAGDEVYVRELKALAAYRWKLAR